MREEPLKVKRINKNSLFVRITVVQIAVCLIIGGVIGAVYKLNRELFNEMGAEFTALMSGGIDLTTGKPKIRTPSSDGERSTGENKTVFGKNDGTEKNSSPENADSVSIIGSSGKEADGDGGAKAPTGKSDSEISDGVLTDGKNDARFSENADGTCAVAVSGTVSAGGIDLDEKHAADVLNFAFYESGDVPCLPVSGSITSVFGKRVHPIYKTNGFHSGTDIAAPKGTPVRAALDGAVTDCGIGELAGKYVRLAHDDGLCTLYCHLDGINTEKGVRVRKGDVVGFVGETGLATGPHLHFEVQRDGEKLDPSFLLGKAKNPC